MKKNLDAFSIRIIIVVLLIIISYGTLKSQTANDSLYLPPISINSLNGYGPYILSGKRSNLFILYNLPENTSKVIMKMIDSKGEQVNQSYTLTGSNLQTAEWSFESDTMGFPLSPQLNIELHYKGDSTAVYQIPYTVYPDTLVTTASAGWGPFTTNNYSFSDTLWDPAPEVENTFTVSTIPPRTDTIEFRMMSTDSTVIASHLVAANPGTYLDSAAYSNVRMDNLPLNTEYLDIVIHCEGGPKSGLHYPKALEILPHKPVLKFISLEETLTDSIGAFVQNQISGQSLAIDSVMHAKITNGPGQRYFDTYPGPYSVDLLKSSYSFEAWLKFDFDQLSADYQAVTIMEVDSVFSFYLGGNSPGTYLLGVESLSNMTWRELWTVNFDKSILGDEQWHHVAFTCYNDGTNYPTGKFYIDGQELPGIDFNQFNYDNILQYSYLYYLLKKTQPLYIGNHYGGTDYLISAIDEVRIWSKAVSHQEILEHNRHAPLQDPDLVGYWNFDDKRNRLNIISDKSFNNNMGTLERGAYFLPQHPAIQQIIDTIRILSSSQQTDSVTFQFVDRNKQVIDRQTRPTGNGVTSLAYDLASLPYNIDKLEVFEHYNPAFPTGAGSEYNLHALAPEPIATPQYNWNKYFSTPDDIAHTYAPVTVSDFPEYSQKVLIGLKKGDELFDTITFTKTSIPYHHSVSLNGNNNYIQTSQKIDAPSEFTIMFWMKTTTTAGGKIVGFCDTQDGNNVTQHDREIILEPDGTIRFKVHNSDGTIVLYGLNKNNDGEWHHIAATAGENTSALLYVDGSLTGDVYIDETVDYQGWWNMGKNSVAKNEEQEMVADHFKGSLSEISIYDHALDLYEINAIRFSEGNHPHQTLYYKLNESSGDSVTDYAGNNDGVIKGSKPYRMLTDDLAFATWNHKVQNHPPGTYTLFTRVFYPDAPEGGAEYDLGNFLVDDPYPGTTFNFGLSLGQGYFSEGIAITNELSVTADTTYSDENNWESDFIGYKLFSPDHELVAEDYSYYTNTPADAYFNLDMGDAPPGSYLSVESGFKENSGQKVVFLADAVPFYFHPLITPKVNCNPGPFSQAIAPGTMQHNNTFTITMEPLTDLSRIALVFTDQDNKQIGTADAEKLYDTLWTATYDMATLSPPYSKLRFEYYLGSNPHPAAVEGPVKISIQRTRPRWFDFVDDDDFTDVEQSGDEVTFEITSPFQKSWLINNFVGVQIPYWVPMLGGMKSELDSPDIKAKLKYYISADDLELNQIPEFYQSYIPLGFGSSDLVRFNFNNSQNNSYYLDENDNLIAIQNFMIGGGAVSDYLVFDDVVKRISQLFDAAETVEPLSNVIKPSFKFSANVEFEYASRLHMTIDTVLGGWGSCGDLHIDANPAHTEAYEKSASYHFYSGSFGIELSIGAELLDGLISGYFGVDGRVALGYGHSYITIPETATRPLKSADFQIYGRFYIDALWGWYEKNLWGPKMFFSHNFWGDDLKNCFPPIDKKAYYPGGYLAGGDFPGLISAITPVSWFTKMNQPTPYPGIANNDNSSVFTWIERGKEYGQRYTRISSFNKITRKFSAPVTITTNNHALNNPVSESLDENLLLLTWSQSRFDTKSIREVKQKSLLGEFAGSLDIWYAVYDSQNNTIIHTEAIEDDFSGTTTGRAEANPEIAVISESKAIITWQVTNLDTDESSIWFATIEKQGEQWHASEPGMVTESPGSKAQLKLSSIGSGKAMTTWLQQSADPESDKKLFYAVYDGNSWTTPQQMLNFPDNESPNYYDLKFRDDLGMLALTSYVNDSIVSQYEQVSLLTWDTQNETWNSKEKVVLHTDTVNHLQYPSVAITGKGNGIIALKSEKIIPKDSLTKISQIDLLSGPLTDNNKNWTFIPGNEFVCDTNNQVKDIKISCINSDTVILLTNEFPMMATNTGFGPRNGVMFGDPYMNLVLRSFAIDESGNISDVDEKGFFVGIDEPAETTINQELASFPNPCREQTTLTFNISNQSNLKLELFDMQGQIVATLANRKYSPGNYEMQLNTNLLKSGIYNCVMTTDDHKSSIRIIVNH